MAIQEAERQALIKLVKAMPVKAQQAAAIGFAIGHEDGWWLARTDPDTTVSPVEHAKQTNPFLVKPLSATGLAVETNEDPSDPRDSDLQPKESSESEQPKS